MTRHLLTRAAWATSAAAAVGLGIAAFSLVDASASPGTTPAGASSALTSSSVPTAVGIDQRSIIEYCRRFGVHLVAMTSRAFPRSGGACETTGSR